MRVAIIGTGYVGLVTGTCLAELGHIVTCIDKNEKRVAQLKRGECPIHEPGLEAMMVANAAAGRLSYTGEAALPVAEADIVFIAVGTPQSAGGGQADLSFVMAAAEEVGRSIRDFTVVAVKSTVPPGTCDQVQAIVSRHARHGEAAVVSNPEFLREGAAVSDFMNPDRVVIGAEDHMAQLLMEELYAPFAGKVPVLFTRRRNSELIKYASNAFLATKIAFVNELAGLCEVADADISEITAGMGLDARIGDRFLAAGPGYGGSCFPKDTAALAAYARDQGSPLCLVESTIRANDQRKKSIARLIARAMGGDLRGKRIAVLGLTFKANTDDMRDAPSLTIIPALQALGADITAYDPAGMAAARPLLPDISLCSSPEAAAGGADALVVLTEWPQFKALDFTRISMAMTSPLIVDCRNLLDASVAKAHGFKLVGIGRTILETEDGNRHDQSIVRFAARSGGRRSGVSGFPSYRQVGGARASGHHR
jgi:UDPglucose 6-dehydrogenase